MPKHSGQDMCPICTEPFQNDEVVIEFRKWDTKKLEEADTFLAHLDCALSLSRKEKRKHP
jgi:hypothetical protein